MALVPNTTSVFSTSPAPSTRPASVATRVASEPNGDVDPLDISTDVSFDATTSGFALEGEQPRLAREDRGQRQDNEPGFNRLFTSNSESFAAILEEPSGSSQSAADTARARSGTPVGKIINTYETNALIITGEQPIRGTALSFSL